ncbi:class I SAM-dependent methyltransferase [Aeromicrobium stalagmiti]|uniref:class I SAM-dependent methyltransferase n=1 Tax=Aeromicrobium stalagmiti TaxID=2738988 RepID=UPI001568CFC4|nr:class I SAM-dependent methyltransferase [Aeromicrobium stalagmiti]NRQ51312.1 class I SAM-dependent methyltransferase [Aeromicrobium stalagmiti]
MPSSSLTARASRRIRTATRVLVKGLPAPAKPAALPKARRSAKPVPGRWVRVTQGPKRSDGAPERRVTDPTEAAAVDAGWLLVDAYERLSTSAAKRVFGHELEAWHQYADDTIELLKSPEGRMMVDIEESAVNRLRYRRTMDFAAAGDRVFDVGFGRGYLAAQLIRGRGVARYHGIDIIDTWVDESYRLLEANGLADADIRLEEGDLFALTPEMVAATEANLVICCEVLEHVDDAEDALRILAEALPEGADLVFSVPLHGRLEHVWGHVSVFDVARLKDMLAGAGLWAHHVEPLANTWTLVVASRSPEPSARVRGASRRPAVNASVPLVRERHFVDVAASDHTPVRPESTTIAVVEGEAPLVECRLTGTGGVRFAVAGIESLRLGLDYTSCEDVRRFDIVAFAGATTVTSWSFTPSEMHAAEGSRFVWLRPGEGSAGFVAAPYGSMLTIDAVEVTAVVADGKTATFGVQAAFLP